MLRPAAAALLSLSLCAHAAEIDLAYGADRQSRWTLDTSNPIVRQEGYIGAWIVSYTTEGRIPVAVIVGGCAQGFGLMYMKWSNATETQWYWTRAGDRIFDLIAMGICSQRGISQ